MHRIFQQMKTKSGYLYQGTELHGSVHIRFLSQLNEINRPITVLFYGDHLPGFYSTAYSDKRTSSDCMRLTISFGPTKRHARLTQSLTLFPATTHHQTISPLSSPNILMQKSVRILRFLPKCIRQFRQCPCRILQAAAALRPIWTRTAISSRKESLEAGQAITP